MGRSATTAKRLQVARAATARAGRNRTIGQAGATSGGDQREQVPHTTRECEVSAA